MKVGRIVWIGMSLVLLIVALLATAAMVAWLSDMNGEFVFKIDDEIVRLHGGAMSVAVAGLVTFVLCLLVLPLGLLLVLAVPMIVLGAIALGVMLPLALVLAVVALPFALLALFIRWLWRRSAGTTTIRA
jgi:hypothetical protein